MPMQDRSLTTPNTGLRLHYRTWGDEGAPPLVLVHGLASTLRIWEFVAPVLAERYFVAAYDQRGHALSDKPPDGYNLPTMLADLVGFVDAMRFEKPVVVGHSWGANLALAYAATYPNRCAGLALVDGGIYDFQDMPETTWEKVRRELAPPDLSRYTLADIVSRMREGVLSSLPRSFVEEYAASMMSVQPDGTIRSRLTLNPHLDILRIIYDMRTVDLLPRVECPVLAVQAAEGEPANERAANFLRMKKQGAERARMLLPDAKIVWMEDTIHDIPLHKPERLAHEIVEFFEGGVAPTQ
jgi:pimeloyl-ACP methyl ester carboxylesterase